MIDNSTYVATYLITMKTNVWEWQEKSVYHLHSVKINYAYYIRLGFATQFPAFRKWTPQFLCEIGKAIDVKVCFGNEESETSKSFKRDMRFSAALCGAVVLVCFVEPSSSCLMCVLYTYWCLSQLGEICAISLRRWRWCEGDWVLETTRHCHTPAEFAGWPFR